MKEGITIDIDTGGTFTDGFFFRGERIERIKVETTTHDLTVCFLDCIEEGARILGFESPREMLMHTEVIRISTTSERRVYWKDGFKDTPVYASDLLECGNIIKGQAIIESLDTTYVVPNGWRYIVDDYLNGRIERETS